MPVGVGVGDGRLVKLPSGGADDAEETEPDPPRETVGAATGTAVLADTDVQTADTDVSQVGGGTPAVADHTDGHGIHLPSPSFYPLVLALGLPCLGYAAVFLEIWWLVPGLIFLLFGIFAWGLEPSVDEEA